MVSVCAPRACPWITQTGRAPWNLWRCCSLGLLPQITGDQEIRRYLVVVEFARLVLIVTGAQVSATEKHSPDPLNSCEVVGAASRLPGWYKFRPGRFDK